MSSADFFFLGVVRCAIDLFIIKEKYCEMISCLKTKMNRKLYFVFSRYNLRKSSIFFLIEIDSQTKMRCVTLKDFCWKENGKLTYLATIDKDATAY